MADKNANLSNEEAEKTLLIGINKPVSKQWDPTASHKMQFEGKGDDYGRPPEGSLTEQRAKKACQHINNEVLTLVSVIRGIGEQDETNPNIYRVTFGELFDYYTWISDKVVGILLRARRWNLVDFKGEMLYQRQDEDKIITLLVGEDTVPTIKKFDKVVTKNNGRKQTLKEKLQQINEGRG